MCVIAVHLENLSVRMERFYSGTLRHDHARALRDCTNMEWNVAACRIVIKFVCRPSTLAHYFAPNSQSQTRTDNHVGRVSLPKDETRLP